MDRVDLVVVGALALAAVASAVGVLTYEDDRGGDFAVAWTTRTDAFDLDEVATSGAAEVPFEVVVDAANVSRVDVEVVVETTTAPGAQPTAVRVEVTRPDGVVLTGEGTLAAGAGASARIPVEAVFAPPPADRIVRAADAASAASAADADVPDDARGTWTVLVRLAPGAPGPLADLETRAVGGTLRATWHAAAVSPALPEVRR